MLLEIIMFIINGQGTTYNKKLHCVQLTIDVMVLAETPEEAQEIVQDRYSITTADSDNVKVIEVKNLSEDSLFYNDYPLRSYDDPSKTCGEWVS